MSIRLGSNDYFREREIKTANINTIGAGKLEGFEAFCAKVTAIMRKCIFWMDDADWRGRVTGRIDILKNKCAHHQVIYNTHVDNHVNQIIQDVQQDAFNSFMSQIPNLKENLQDLKKFHDMMRRHTPLNEAINAINGSNKIDALNALGELPSILAELNPQDGEFYEKTGALLSQLLEKNEFIGANLQKLTRVMTGWDDYAISHKNLVTLDKAASSEQREVAWMMYEVAQGNVLRSWEQNSKSIENLLSEEGFNKSLTIPLALEWAEKMKEQKINLILSVDSIVTENSPYQFEKHGFFQDRVDEARLIAKSQKKELGKLDLSFANFIADKTNESFDLITQNLRIEKSDILDVIRVSEDALEPSRMQVFNKFWTLDHFSSEAVQGKGLNKDLTQEINKNYSKQNEDTLVAVYANSIKMHKAFDVELATYHAKYAFTTLGLMTEHDRQESLGVTVDSSEADCGKINVKANDAINALNDFKTRLNDLKRNNVSFEFEFWGEPPVLFSFDEVEKWIQDQTYFYNKVLREVEDRLMDIALIKTLNDAEDQRIGAAHDQQFLDKLLEEFNLVQTADDGNCFFHAIKAGLDQLPDERLDFYKMMSAEGLRIELYEYIKANSGEFQMNIATSLSDDVLTYANATGDEAERLIHQKAPALRKMYKDFKEAYRLSSDADKDILAEGLLYEYLSDEMVKRYADAMADNATYVDMIEIMAMKEMLGIRLGLHSPIVGGGVESELIKGSDDLPIIHVLRPGNKPHFDLLIEKK